MPQMPRTCSTNTMHQVILDIPVTFDCPADKYSSLYKIVVCVLVCKRLV